MSIHPNDYNLKQVLSESGDLYVPWFQRNYTWDEDNIDELFHDLFEEYSWENIVESARSRNALRDYFMGAVMLCGQGDGRRMILDGQQRLTTLTMLLAWVLKKMSQHPALASLHAQGVSILRNQAEANRLELKKDAPGKIVIARLLALIKSGSSMPDSANGPIPNKPFSDCKITFIPCGM